MRLIKAEQIRTKKYMYYIYDDLSVEDFITVSFSSQTNERSLVSRTRPWPYIFSDNCIPVSQTKKHHLIIFLLISSITQLLAIFTFLSWIPCRTAANHSDIRNCIMM